MLYCNFYYIFTAIAAEPSESGHKEGCGQAKSNFVPITWGEKQGTVKMDGSEGSKLRYAGNYAMLGC